MTQTVPAPSLPPDLVHLLETYCIGRKLGGGSFGTVRGSSEPLCESACTTAVDALSPVQGLTAIYIRSCTLAQSVQQ